LIGREQGFAAVCRDAKIRETAVHKTRIDLKSNVRKTSIETLNALVADSIDLALSVKQAHWNVRGKQFIAVHEMLDGFRATLDGHVDTMAERVVQLGGVALGATQIVARASRLPPYPTDISKVEDHLVALADRFAAVGKAAREGVDSTDEAGDKDTVDILTAMSRDLDKSLWFVEAHIEP
jgi:starvation-inducible DNA-binding protein